MELDSIECISVSDGITDDDEVARVPLSFLKPHGDGSGVPAPQVISPVSRVHELLECPVCGDSMYPPIHQVRFSPSGFSLSMRAWHWGFGCSGFCRIFYWFRDSSGIDVLFVPKIGFLTFNGLVSGFESRVSLKCPVASSCSACSILVIHDLFFIIFVFQFLDVYFFQ